LNLKKIKDNLLDDVYYSIDYVSLYLKDNEEIFEFNYKEGDKILYNLSIKRPIISVGEKVIDEGCFDLETAYGYGGFYTNTDDRVFIKNAMFEYAKKCADENIIAEFVRFHPFNDFLLQNYGFFDMNINDRDTVVVQLFDRHEENRRNYSSSLRRNINKAVKNNLVYKKEHINSSSIECFMGLYFETMKRNNAESFYFFQVEYFEGLFKNDNVMLHSVSYNNKVISMVVTLHSNGIIYYHLGATDGFFYNLNPNAFIFDSIIANSKGDDRFLYLGGGATSSNEDSLLMFKKKFSKEIKPFFISGKVYNKEIYDKYVDAWEKQTKIDIRYFLKYRLGIK